MCDINQAFQLLLSPSISNTNSSTYYSYEYENKQQVQVGEKCQQLLCQVQNSYEQQYRKIRKKVLKVFVPYRETITFMTTMTTTMNIFLFILLVLENGIYTKCLL